MIDLRLRSVAVTALVVADCVSLHMFAQDKPLANDGTTLTSDQIADKTDQTLREAHFLEIEGTMTQTDLIGDGKGVVGGTAPLKFRMWMSSDALRTEVEQGGKLVVAFAWCDGRFQEYRPQMNHEPIIEYKAPQPYGTDDTVLKASIDCRLAPLTDSWLNVNSYFRDYFLRKIREGEVKATEKVSGRDCYVIHHSEESGLVGTIYVDHASFIVRRRDATYQDVLRSMTLERIEVHDKPPQAFQWKLHVNEQGLIPSLGPGKLQDHLNHKAPNLDAKSNTATLPSGKEQ